MNSNTLIIHGHVSEKRNSLSDSNTSRSEGTVCKSELAGSGRSLPLFPIPVGAICRALPILTRSFLLAVRSSTPVLGNFAVLLFAFVWFTVVAGACATLSDFRSFTLNLNGGLYTTWSLARSFLAREFDEFFSSALPVSAPGRRVDVNACCLNTGTLDPTAPPLAVRPTGVDLLFGIPLTLVRAPVSSRHCEDANNQERTLLLGSVFVSGSLSAWIAE